MSISNPIKICFAGSGDLAVPILESLLKNQHIIVKTIITQPDKPAGRKKILTPCPVGLFCQEQQIPTIKPQSVNSLEVLTLLKEDDPDFIVVASFGQLLKKDFLKIPHKGCLNIHTSLLPRWRGASPITTVILEGEAQTGICFMAMDEGLDTGPVYLQKIIPLNGTETTASLEQKMAKVAAENIVNILEQIDHGEITPIAQPLEGSTYAKKIKKEHGLINWNDAAIMTERKIRAYIPWPKAFFKLTLPKGNQINIQITEAEVVSPTISTSPPQPGEILQADKNGLIIACGEQAIKINRLIPEGKKEMTATDFLLGRPLPIHFNINEPPEMI